MSVGLASLWRGAWPGEERLIKYECGGLEALVSASWGSVNGLQGGPDLYLVIQIVTTDADTPGMIRRVFQV